MSSTLTRSAGPGPATRTVDPAATPEVQSGRSIIIPPTTDARGSKLPVPRTRRARMMRPRAGASLAGLRPQLRWRQVAGARFYNVQIFELRGTQWVKVRSVFPRRATTRVNPGLRAGRRYAWQVWPWKGGSYRRSAVRISYFDTLGPQQTRLTQPRASSVKPGRDITLRWKAAPGTGAYVVRVSGSGRYTTRTRRTKAVVPSEAVKRGRLRIQVYRAKASGQSRWADRRISVR